MNDFDVFSQTRPIIEDKNFGTITAATSTQTEAQPAKCKCSQQDYVSEKVVLPEEEPEEDAGKSKPLPQMQTACSHDKLSALPENSSQAEKDEAEVKKPETESCLSTDKVLRESETAPTNLDLKENVRKAQKPVHPKVNPPDPSSRRVSKKDKLENSETSYGVEVYCKVPFI